MSKLLSFFQLVAVIATTALYVQTSCAQKTYPNKPVRFIIPWPAGNTTSDVILRPITIKLSEAWGQQVLLENRAGASGMIGTEHVARAAPDGYTLLMAGSPIYIAPSLFKNVPYNSLNDFAPITLLALVPNVVAVHPSVPATTVKELIALARSKPGQLNFAGTGNATPGHLGGELFNTMAGVNMLHVPYKGGAPAMVAAISGEVSVIFVATGGAIAQAQAGRLRIIAVTTRERIPQLPDTPTVSEAGLAGYEIVSWYGILAPAGISPGLLSKLHTDILHTMNSKEVREPILSRGAIPIGNTPDEFKTRIRQDIDKWKKLITASGAKLD